jgi:hypothetical protein
MPNYDECHENKLGSITVELYVSNLSTRWCQVFNFTSQMHPLDALLDKLQSQSELCGEEASLFSLNPQFLAGQPVAYLWLLPLYVRLIL